jgi:hypothetical protein
MAYYQPPDVQWDQKPALWRGVTLKRRLADGNVYAWYIPYNGVVTQAMAADIFDVSVMTINNWVNAGLLKTIKQKGVPSLITLYDLKRMRKRVLEQRRRRGP